MRAGDTDAAEAYFQRSFQIRSAQPVAMYTSARSS
jgi:Tfp pilus assembly protein PilF